MKKFLSLFVLAVSVTLVFAGVAAAADARHMAYMRAARNFVEKHKFPNGESINKEDLNLGLGDFSENKLAICDVNGDGKPELLISFEATHMVAKLGYVCGFNEKTKKLTIQLDGFPAFDFFDNGYVKANVSHNQGLAGRFWPYTLLKFDAGTGQYECVGGADAWDKEDFPENFQGEAFPDKVDVTGEGIVYYIEDENFKEAKGSETPVDTSVYKKWEASWLGDAKPVDIPWVSADAKGLRALEKQK